MGKVIKITAGLLIGIATVWPLAHLSLFTYFFFSGDNIFPGKEIPYRVKVLMYLQPYMFFTLATLIVSFIIYALISKKVPKDKKALWASLIIFGGILITPIFWYHYIWKNRNA